MDSHEDAKPQSDCAASLNSSRLCVFVRAGLFLGLAANFTQTSTFIFCDLCPKAADFRDLLGHNLGPSVTFEIAAQSYAPVRCGRAAGSSAYPDCQRACPAHVEGPVGTIDDWTGCRKALFRSPVWGLIREFRCRGFPPNSRQVAQCCDIARAFIACFAFKPGLGCGGEGIKKASSLGTVPNILGKPDAIIFDR
ncbi:hypothetical protein NYA22BAC_01244 [Parasphingorhabdus sp. NYA22]